jgi:hypothetical protein
MWRIVVLAVVATFVGLCAGCRKSTVPSGGSGKDTGSPTDTDPTNSPWKTEEVTGSPFYLEPVPWEGPGPRPVAHELPPRFLSGLASDADSHRLLQRLHGGATVEFIAVLDEPDAKVRKQLFLKTPPARNAVSWAVTWSTRLVDPDLETQFPGIRHYLGLFLSWTYLTKLDGLQPESRTILLLTCNDYLLRHQTGYQLRSGLFPPDDLSRFRFEKRTVSELRRDLDEKIEDYVKTLPAR